MIPLVRLFADPRKVRVAFRAHPKGWRIEISSLVTGVSVVTIADDPEAGVKWALLHAQEEGIDGIDLDLAWTYDHPQTDPQERQAWLA